MTLHRTTAPSPAPTWRRQRVQIPISLPAPVRDAPETEWICRFETAGLGEDFGKEVCGVDGIQALELTIQLLGVIEELEQLSLPDG